MEFIAVRHAVTPFNEAQLINGRIDESLSKEGLQQIPSLIFELGSYTFDAVYSSPLKRAWETAEPIAAHFHVPLYEDERLVEVDFGSLAGQSWDATVPYFGVNSSGVLNTFAYDLRPFGGEAAGQTKARVQSFLDKLQKQSGRPLVICHGGILRWFYYICAYELAAHIPNSSVHTFILGKSRQ